MSMNWSSWADFAAMGGYGRYVWASFGVAALLLLAEVAALRARRRALRQQPQAEGGLGWTESAHEA